MTTPEVPNPPPVGPRPTPLALVSIVSLVTAAGLGGLQLVAPGKAGDVPSIFGTVSSWISAGGIMGILSLLVWFLLGKSKLHVEAMTAKHADSADVRDTYAEIVAGLRQERADQANQHQQQLADVETRYSRNVAIAERHYQDALKTAEERHALALKAAENRHAECERKCEELVGKVRCLEQKVRGMEDQLRSQASDRVLVLESSGEQPSEAVADSARRVKDIVANRDGQAGGGDTDAES
jgi:hypothetical protein